MELVCEFVGDGRSVVDVGAVFVLAARIWRRGLGNDVGWPIEKAAII